MGEEKQRLIADHPGEADAVHCVHGGQYCYAKARLQPTRSFGDFYLKHHEFNGPPYPRVELNGGQSENVDPSKGMHIPEPFTPPYITATPEVKTRTISEQDEFVVIGSDGVWDFLTNQEAVDIVKEAIEDGHQYAAGRIIVEKVLERAAEQSQISVEKLLSFAAGRGRRGRHDDTTAVVLFLK